MPFVHKQTIKLGESKTVAREEELPQRHDGVGDNRYHRDRAFKSRLRLLSLIVVVVIVLAECTGLGAAKQRGLIYNKDGKFIYRPAKSHQGHIIVIDDRHRSQPDKPNSSDPEAPTTATTTTASSSSSSGVATLVASNSTGERGAATGFGWPILPAFQTVQLIAPGQATLAAPATASFVESHHHHQQLRPQLPNSQPAGPTSQLIDVNELQYQRGQPGYADQQPVAASSAVATNYATMAYLQQQQQQQPGQQPYHLMPMIRVLDATGYRLIPLAQGARQTVASLQQQQQQQQVSSLFPAQTTLVAPVGSQFASYPSSINTNEQVYANQPMPTAGAEQFVDRGDRLFEPANDLASPGVSSLFEPVMYDIEQDAAGSPYAQLGPLVPAESMIGGQRPRHSQVHQQQQQSPALIGLADGRNRLHHASHQTAVYQQQPVAPASNPARQSRYSPFGVDYYDDGYYQERGATSQQQSARSPGGGGGLMNYASKRYREVGANQEAANEPQQARAPKSRSQSSAAKHHYNNNNRFQHSNSNNLTPGQLGGSQGSALGASSSLQDKRPPLSGTRSRFKGPTGAGERNNYDENNGNNNLDIQLDDQSSNYWNQFKEQFEII